MTNARVTTRHTRIGLVDFEPLRVAGLREILARRPSFDVIATGIGEALRNPDFDLVLMLEHRLVESCALLGRLKQKNPDLKVIMVSPETGDESVMTAILSGAKGWLHQTASPEQILQAVDVVAAGSIWAPRKILSQMVDRVLGNSGAPLRPQVPRLTLREEEVLEQLIMARSNREIAEALSIREQTVKSYMAKLMKKVGVDNRISLSMEASQATWWRTK